MVDSNLQRENILPSERARAYKMLIDTIDAEQATPSLSPAQRLKKLSQSGELTDDSMLSIMSEQKKPENSFRFLLTLRSHLIKRFLSQ